MAISRRWRVVAGGPAGRKTARSAPTRWIGPPHGIHLQVSEFAKFVIVLLVARFLIDRRSDVLEMRDFLKLAGLIVVPMAMIAKEPDLGTALTYIPILAIGVLLAGMRWKIWVAIGVVALVVLPLGFTKLQPYQRARIASFLDPERDPQGTGYQLIQSKIAVGAGGTWGKGVTKGSQTQLRFLPVPHTDFIFSAFAEEHGFIQDHGGAGVVLYFADAGRPERTNRLGQSGHVYLHGGCGASVISYTGKCRDGDWKDARDRDPSAADELWRIERVVDVSDARPCKQRAVKKICELSVLPSRDCKGAV